MRKVLLCCILSVLIFICGCSPISSGETDIHSDLFETAAESSDKTPEASGITATSSVPETTAETTVYIKPAPVVISFLAAGDNLIHDNIYKEAGEIAAAMNKTGSYDFTPMYAPLADKIFEADIAFINQETPLAGESFGYSGYPQFNSPQMLGTDLQNVGFDVVNIANNHMLDRRAKGLIGTMDFLRDSKIFQIGGYLDRADFDRPRVYETEGVKIAFVSFTYGTNGINLDSDSDIFIPLYTDGINVDEELLTDTVKKAEAAADFTIVSMHWGWEGTYAINDEQRNAAKIMCDAGADVIIGTHPHVVQDTEWLTSENGNKTLVYYSLGNFISAQTPYYNMIGGLASFNIIKEDGKEAYAADALYIPTMTYFDSRFRNTTVYTLEDFPEDLIKTHGRSSVREMTKEQLVRSVTDNVNSDFLDDYYGGEAPAGG
jgi:poly-gamma-glutamate synthesis protein (capsule biosynthesis protein)